MQLKLCGLNWMRRRGRKETKSKFCLLFGIFSMSQNILQQNLDKHYSFWAIFLKICRQVTYLCIKKCRFMAFDEDTGPSFIIYKTPTIIRILYLHLDHFFSFLTPTTYLLFLELLMWRKRKIELTKRGNFYRYFPHLKPCDYRLDGIASDAEKKKKGAKEA